MKMTALVALLVAGCGGAPSQGVNATPAPRSAPSAAKTDAATAKAPSASETELFKAPKDSEIEDKSLPPGTIGVMILDADDHPVAGVNVAFARDDGRTPLMTKKSDSRGRSSLVVAPGEGYAVTATYDGGRFAAQFVVPAADGVAVRLHVYRSTPNLAEAKMAFQALVTIERKSDRLVVEETFRAVVLSRKAWRADVGWDLPKEATGFIAGAMPEQLRIVRTTEGARLVDTVAPGEHEAQFLWEFAAAAGRDVRLAIGLPPNVAIARVITNAKSGLEVAGFAPAHPDNGTPASGPVFIAEKFARPGEPAIEKLEIVVR